MPYSGEQYCLAQWRRTPDGFVPDLPDGIDWLLLAEPARDKRRDPAYGIFLVTQNVATTWPPSIEFVPEYLADLLYSAICHYPPAMAISRNNVRSSAALTGPEFMAALADELRLQLDGQRDSPFFLAKVRQEELGYKIEGQYHWVVGYREDGGKIDANFVSDDFFVYSSPATDFDINLDWLRKRFPSGR